MTTPLDEAAAWRHVRSVAAGESRHDGEQPRAAPVGQAILDLYLPLLAGPELVIGQMGQSLDGRIATETGASHYVTGPEDLDRLHRLRALCDAVVVGANTVASDDPQLTVRRVDGENPVRVVLDPGARLDPGHRLFTDGAAPTLVVHRDGVDGVRASTFSKAGVEVLTVPVHAESDEIDLTALLRTLRARGLARVLVEGGGITVSNFLRAGLLDRLHIVVAPMLIGSGRPSISLPAIATLDEALRPHCRHVILGRDVLFDLDLRAEAS